MGDGRPLDEHPATFCRKVSLHNINLWDSDLKDFKRAAVRTVKLAVKEMIKALPGAIRSLNRNPWYQGWFVSLCVAGGGGFTNHKVYCHSCGLHTEDRTPFGCQIWRNQESSGCYCGTKGCYWKEESNHTSIASPPRLRLLCERQGEDLRPEEWTVVWAFLPIEIFSAVKTEAHTTSQAHEAVMRCLSCSAQKWLMSPARWAACSCEGSSRGTGPWVFTELWWAFLRWSCTPTLLIH